MSKREGIFCDATTEVWGGGNDRKNKQLPCDQIAVGKCVICDRDVCSAHSLHPYKGVAISIDLITTSVQGKLASGLPNVTDFKIGETFAHRIFVCKSCTGIRNSSSIENFSGLTNGFKKRLGAAIEEAAVATLRGQLVAEALDK